MPENAITNIQIKNIKGLQNFHSNLILFPNKPNILVAPNGFGKSSFAIAFQGIKNKIKLSKDTYYKNDENNHPSIKFDYYKTKDEYVEYFADKDTSNILKDFDIHVINSRIFAKPASKYVNKDFSRSVASLEIEPIVIIDKIPGRINLDNVIAVYKLIKKDLRTVLYDFRILTFIDNNLKLLDCTLKCKNNIVHYCDKKHYKDFKAEIEKIQKNKKFNTLYINIANHINSNDETLKILITASLCEIYSNNKDDFKNLIKYKLYIYKKDFCQNQIQYLDKTWSNIKIREEKQQLKVEFPQANKISNGQRDIWILIIELLKLIIKPLNKNTILIIDEVFDYLDDANLIVVQYFISKIINLYKKNNNKIYPIILTHLDPCYFKSYVFNDNKVWYLKDDYDNININNDIISLLKKRNNDKTQKSDIEKYCLHYHPDEYSLKDFKLKNTELLTNTNLYYLCDKELNNYLNNNPYCPLSVCLSLRVMIEKYVFSLLKTEEEKDIFIETHKTKSKIECFSEQIKNIDIILMLGLIYNKGLHWTNSHNEYNTNIIPILNNLSNNNIRMMINILNKEVSQV